MAHPKSVSPHSASPHQLIVAKRCQRVGLERIKSRTPISLRYVCDMFFSVLLFSCALDVCFFLLVYPMNCSAQRGNANEVAINIYIYIVII